jgi:hypothetical protein
MYVPYFNHRNHKKFGFGPMHWVDKNKTLLWYPSDTEEKFDNHWTNPRQKELLIKSGWGKTSITYKRNDAAFRMNLDMINIIPGECDFYLGCSHTFGVGINLEDTWGWKLSQKKGLTFVNLGCPGGSFETQYRMLVSWAGVLKPRRAFTLGSYEGRREILHPDGVAEQFGSWVSHEPQYTMYRRMSNENEELISSLRTLDAMRAVCIRHSIELYTIDRNIRNDVLRIGPKDKMARDLIHYSPDWHSRIAELPDIRWERLV